MPMTGNDMVQDDDMAGKPSIIVGAVDGLSDHHEPNVFSIGADYEQAEVKRISAQFGGLDVGDLPEEEDLDASQEPGSMGGVTSGHASASGGRVMQGGLGSGQMGGGGDSHGFGAGP